jgi:hypothetical protein
VSGRTPPRPTNEELRDLVLQALALEYLHYRDHPSENKPDADKKPLWLQLFESAGFAALVTVLVGGLAGAVITSMLQRYGKERDARVAESRLEHDRQVTAYRQHLDRERQVVDEMYLRLGKFVDASRDLTTLSRREFCEECQKTPLPKRVVTEKQGVLDRYDSAMVDWNSNRLRLGMLLQLEHQNDRELLDDLEKASDAAERYAECADRWRTKYDQLEIHEALKACEQSHRSVDESVQLLTNRILTLRLPSPAQIEKSSWWSLWRLQR